MSLAARRAALADLSPANFAIVMATGILSIDAHLQGHEWLAQALLAVNAVAWVTVAVLMLARLRLHPARMLDDLHSHLRAPAFLTAVAGTAVLASQFFVLGVALPLVPALAALAAVLWLVLTYGVLLVLTVRQDKPTLQDGIGGAWLLAVVGTQSIAVVAALLASAAEPPARMVLDFAALSFWLTGGMVYVWLIALIFYRYTFLRFAPRDLAPPYWINMGAMAISVLAGSLLVLNAAQAPLLAELLPFLKGGTVLYWATGTWWIPMLLVLTLWRYVRHRYPLRYDPVYWSAVFPLGMYSAATHQMALALNLRFLAPVARGFFFLGLLAWVVAAAGLLHRLATARSAA